MTTSTQLRQHLWHRRRKRALRCKLLLRRPRRNQTQKRDLQRALLPPCRRFPTMPLHSLPGLQNNKVSIFSRSLLDVNVADHNFCLAEIDRLRKATQSMAQDTKPKEVKRPLGSIANLQKAMGLENDRALYMTCRVSFSFLLFVFISILINILVNY